MCVPIVASETTRQQAPDYIWQELDRVRVKGVARSIAIFSPLVAVGDLSPDQVAELALWQTFLTAYRAQSWPQCDMLIGQLQEKNSNKPLYRLYAQRIAMMREQTLDPGWDGATNFETK
jgi:adenylate cyclase